MAPNEDYPPGYTKLCDTCLINKPPLSFIVNSRSPDGLRYTCKQCEGAWKPTPRLQSQGTPRLQSQGTSYQPYFPPPTQPTHTSYIPYSAYLADTGHPAYPGYPSSAQQPSQPLNPPLQPQGNYPGYPGYPSSAQQPSQPPNPPLKPQGSYPGYPGYSVPLPQLSYSSQPTASSQLLPPENEIPHGSRDLSELSQVLQTSTTGQTGPTGHQSQSTQPLQLPQTSQSSGPPQVPHTSQVPQPPQPSSTGQITQSAPHTPHSPSAQSAPPLRTGPRLCRRCRKRKMSDKFEMAKQICLACAGNATRLLQQGKVLCIGACRQEKPLSDFVKSKLDATGYRPHCKQCSKDRWVGTIGNELFSDLNTAGISLVTDDNEDDQDQDDVGQQSLSIIERYFPSLLSGPVKIDKRYTRGCNYWELTKAEIAEKCAIKSVVAITKDALIHIAQREEAARGLLPIPRALHSRYHYMGHSALFTLAESRGWNAFSRAEQSRLSKEFEEDRLLATGTDGDLGMLDVDDLQTVGSTLAGAVDDEYEDERTRMIRWLLSQDHGSNEEFWEVMGDAARSTAASILVDDLTLSLGFKPKHRQAYQLCRPVHHNPSQLRQVRLGEVVGITGTQTALNSLYYLLHDGRIVPQPTSSRGLLCGVLALERSFEFMQRRLYTVNTSLWSDAPPRITYVEMMHLLFSDWDPTRQYRRGDTATPTPAYDAYIRQQYGSLLTEGNDVLFNDTYTELTQVMDLDAMQLQAILTLLYSNGNNPHVPMHYQLGVVRSGYWRQAKGIEQPVSAYARFVNDPDPDLGQTQPRQVALWIHNRTALGLGEYNHFEGMDDSAGEGYYDVLSWAMRVDADEYKGPGRGVQAINENLADETVDEVDKRITHNAGRSQKKVNEQIRQGCIPCREKNRACTGIVWQSPCPECEAAELYDDNTSGCTWDDHFRPKEFFASAATPEVREQYFERWNMPHTAAPNPYLAVIDPIPDNQHFLTISLARSSSTRAPAAMAVIAIAQQATLHHYDNMLNAGPNANIQVVHFPEGVRPTAPNGGYLQMRRARFAIARHGARAVPTTTGNLNNPVVIRLVGLFHEVFGYQQPVQANRPHEIHMLLNGFAGLSVGIPAWGSRLWWDGFFAWVRRLDALNNTDLAKRIFIVVLIEPHVVDGAAAHSLEHPNRTARFPRHRGKHLHKKLLADLIDRLEVNRAVANGIAPPPHPAWTVQEAHDLDLVLRAMRDEASWRQAQLDGTTAPTDGEFNSRNQGRNAGMQ
ncbi:hypothetical protein B0A48_16063 [Cryoendolithus antarcticus]|uniref:Uncharacterized protein n=1 Tax=Cryoendolithus antarcticus TaxID=1507870 RepID=A0A1V8SF13_9PEZI|nr:hypothetical protein B0A48_16063 [Cryoendolithus antarcticus]